jgi:hypothetical protein
MRLVIDMKDMGDRVEAIVKLGRQKKTYTFPFSVESDQSNRIGLFISSLPMKFYIDAFLNSITK